MGSGSTDDSHEVYGPEADTWETFPPLLQSRHGIGVAVVVGKIYVIGGGPAVGFSQSRTVQVFTPYEKWIMNQDLIANASIVIDAPRATVWEALITPEAIKQYMFGTNVSSDWKEGSPITWSGKWEGKSYEDKGTIKRIEPERLLQYTHFSPLSGLPDAPENYHTVTIELSDDGDQTRVSLSQDNNPNEEARAHSKKNWEAMLAALKAFVEE